ncbi:hypothetical protein KBD18_02070 [Patescibacteria group bacterium]|nr:hypothetical protein [Patescibacteria group bacterium]
MEAYRSATASPHGKIFLSWEVDEYPRYQRTVLWYVIAGLIGTAFLWYALATVNFLFALIVIIFAIVVLLSGTRESHRVRVALTEDGLEIGTRFHSWKDFQNFWLVYEPPGIKVLYLMPRSSFQPAFAVPLEDINPNAVRETLLAYIQEDMEREEEPLADALARMLKL